MRGLVLLFLAIALSGIAWGYASKESRSAISKLVRKNLLSIVLALLAVAAAIFFSMNSIVRLA